MGSSGLENLCELRILDTEREPEFDELARLAAAICDAPISIVSLLDQDRHWFKAAVGTDVSETPRSLAFCDHTVRQDGLFLVEDSRADRRFADNPYVTGKEDWRFYAGFPVDGPGGSPVGTLCVIDHKPRALEPAQKLALQVLASQVTARLELRWKRLQFDEALKRAEDARADSVALQQRFERFMDSGPFLAYMKDADGRMLYYNHPLAERFQVTRDAMLGRTDGELWPPANAMAFREHDLAVLRDGKQAVTLEHINNADGSSSSWQSYKFVCPSPRGDALLCGVSIEVTEQLQREEELKRVQRELQQANLVLEKLASVDTLTGLSARRIFDEKLRFAFREAKRTCSPLSVLLLDVDNFKTHNDSHGHQHGDRVLQALGTCLQEQFRPTDTVARYGGEEFAVLVVGASHAEALALAERLLKTIRALSVDELAVTASIGVSSLAQSVKTPADLIGRADQALFDAKRAGKNNARCFAAV